ncbi:ribosome biogenesis GTP-binding protein YihA/YsxC [Mycoplasma sp. 4404]|uniref:ribosome biogenesis GTP-binding protein YihA/YsxC n=1 Tax=Mycoplasma sp. 4404 TaxID=3108530 RepID=UPI002B1DA403|nr:ribosome biogenesis GTP-binding protein YihA/YsxC [Mycoplasma sp. 4404]MEA4162790.1 ribosome biogenesis GTP-binding protein YihA/YsxC [Mycoplasma sp. 4404]
MFKFIKSSTNRTNWYEHPNYEVAFWGRSNVGKSSLINAIVENKKLAKTSKTPGRTQLINYFENEFGAVLVDLPGYGYAKISQTQKDKMMKMIYEYLIERKNLRCVYLLIDSRHGITNTDVPELNFLISNNINFKLVFTKTDKLKQKDKNQLLNHIKSLRNQLGNFEYFLVSSEKKVGIEQLSDDLTQTLSGDENEID